MDAPNKLLILTVGSGTGKTSTIAEGLITTIRQSKCAAYILVSSTSPDSLAVADLVSGCVPGNIVLGLNISNPDDIFDCINIVNEGIASALRLGYTYIVINPTSGTKQMTSGAIIAGVNGDVTAFEFINGVRSDGTITSGTEGLVTYFADNIVLNRDKALAKQLFDIGDYAAARIIVQRNALLAYLLPIIACADAWEKEDYALAFFNAKLSANLLLQLPTLTSLISGAGVADDILFTANLKLKRGDYQAALRLFIKGIELKFIWFITQNFGFTTAFDAGLTERSSNWDFGSMRRFFSFNSSMYSSFDTSIKQYITLRNKVMHGKIPNNLEPKVKHLATLTNTFFTIKHSSRPTLQ